MSFRKIRLLCCGDRAWQDRELIKSVLTEIQDLIECVIEGEARGADTIARGVAEELQIPVEKFPAEWDKHGRAAGPIRNQQMIDEGNPSLVFAFHDNIIGSKGTKDMCNRARRFGIEVRIFSHKSPKGEQTK